ncbi:hypothetical protein V8B97DRAFT_1864612 [Scleroderma yunnanense]
MAAPACSTLSCFPEELLLRILSFCVSPLVVLPRSPLHVWDYVPHNSHSPHSKSPARNRLALLYVSRQFHRITLPLFYRTLHLQSAIQLNNVLESLKARPSLAHAVRKVIFNAIWRDCDVLLMLCKRIDDLDICLDLGRGRSGSVCDVEAKAFCTALAWRDITRLTIRKDPITYLTHDRPRYVLEGLARAIPRWSNLESVHLALRLSPSPTTIQLAEALSMAPRLRSIRSQVPAVWNNLLFLASSNPALEKITLYEYPGYAIPRGPSLAKHVMMCNPDDAILGTGMYITDARKHARLFELIKAGTSFIRIRAHSTIATMSGDGDVVTPLSPSKVKELANGLLDGR